MGISLPIFALAKAFDSLSCACIDSFAHLGVERAEHVCGDCRIVYVGTCRYPWEEKLAQCQCEGVAHCIDEDVRDDASDGLITHDERAKTLTEEGETRPGTAENPRASLQVEENDRRRMQVDVETILHSFKNGRFRGVAVTSVDCADGIRPEFLRSLDGCPQDPFTSASGVAEWMEEANYALPVFFCPPTICG